MTHRVGREASDFYIAQCCQRFSIHVHVGLFFELLARAHYNSCLCYLHLYLVILSMGLIVCESYYYKVLKKIWRTLQNVSCVKTSLNIVFYITDKIWFFEWRFILYMIHKYINAQHFKMGRQKGQYFLKYANLNKICRWKKKKKASEFILE